MSDSCDIPPCILWNVSAVYFGIGCLLIALALVSRYVIKLLLSVIGLVIRWQGKQSWNIRLKSSLLVPTTWFLRTGLLLGAYLILLDEPPLTTTITSGFFYMFAVVFCICWFWFSFVFLSVVSQLIVEEYEIKEMRKEESKQKNLKSSEDRIAKAMMAVVNVHGKQLRSSRATALTQVLMIFRLMILVVIIALICSLLNISFTELLNDTNIWFFPLLLALAPHLRSIYLGTLLTFLFTDDDWTPVQAGNVCSMDGLEYASEETSLARARMTRLADGATVVAPLNYLFDSGAQLEGQRLSAMPICVELCLHDGLSAEEVAVCRSKAETFLTTISVALTLNLVNYDASTNRLMVVGSAMSSPQAYEGLRGDVIMGLIDALRPFLHKRIPTVSFLSAESFPEIGFSSDSSQFDYHLLEPNWL
jgi:hypothetical protein